MKEDPAALMFSAYFIVWAVLVIASWVHVRSRSTPQEKKKWYDRWCIITGIVVTGWICLILLIWKQYIGIPLLLAGGIAITLLNLRNTFYCGSCGKQSHSQTWSSKLFHCPHCGVQLK